MDFNQCEINVELSNVTFLLEESKKYNLDAEVVYYALKSMKENPQQTIYQAMESGFAEWVNK